MKSSDMNDKNNKDRQGFSIDTILEFVKKNIRYITAGVLFLALVLVLSQCTGDKNGRFGEESATATEFADTSMEKYQVDAVPEVNELIANYYNAYAEGKIKKLRQYATPVTKNERSFIKLFSENVEEYQNIKCYTKKGLNEGSYLVSVYLEIKFKDVDTLAPGLDFFYVETNDAGELVINNRYSQFNLLNKEKELDADIQALIESFEQEADVVALRQEIQEKYDAALASDEKLATMMNTTIAEVYAAWAKEVAQNQQTEGEEQTTEDAIAEGDTSAESEGDAQPQAEIVYALDTVNIRAEANEDATIVDMVVAGTALTRIGKTEDGWSKLTYDGKEVYVKSDYITTEKPKKEEPKEDNTASQNATSSQGSVNGYAEGTQITLSETVNVRASMGEDAEKVGTAFAGETLTVIFSYAEGWTKIEWNGQTGFVKTEFLK